MDVEVALSILSVLGINGILLFFIKRFFEKKDSEAKEEKADRDALIREVRTRPMGGMEIWILGQRRFIPSPPRT